MKITYIKWLDAAGTSENIWQGLETLPDTLLEIQTAGFIMSEDETRITIASNQSEFSFMGDITIPKNGIVERKDFTV